MRNPNIVFLKPLENVKIRIVAIGGETLVNIFHHLSPIFSIVAQHHKPLHVNPFHGYNRFNETIFTHHVIRFRTPIVFVKRELHAVRLPT